MRDRVGLRKIPSTPANIIKILRDSCTAHVSLNVTGYSGLFCSPNNPICDRGLRGVHRKNSVVRECSKLKSVTNGRKPGGISFFLSSTVSYHVTPDTMFHPTQLQQCAIIYWYQVAMPPLCCHVVCRFLCQAPHLGTGFKKLLHSRMIVPTCCSFAKNIIKEDGKMHLTKSYPSIMWRGMI